jgi:hypothetical protein
VFRFVPLWAIETGRSLRSIVDWVRRGCVGYAPQFVKQRVLMKYCVPGAPWVETGTYLGTTTKFLAARSPLVHTIEPATSLYEGAVRRFRGRNVVLHHGTSEAVLPRLLPDLRGSVNFWLDGHFSAGLTYRSDKESPLLDELAAIRANLSHMHDVAIFIDDIRCCVPTAADAREGGYPALDELVAWARENGFGWRIEQDIMIISRPSADRHA